MTKHSFYRLTIPRIDNLREWIGLWVPLFAALVVVTPPAETHAQSSQDAELAQELSNPIADLISLPIQINYDSGIGPGDDGERITSNVQPVIPFKVNDEWNVISRTILPITYQDDIFPGAGSQFGLGDVTQSLFFSPKRPAFGKVIWGAGPVVLLPTATDSKLGSEKWGAGPTAVGLVVSGSWTVGALANHVWSFAGDDDRADINRSFIQPFVAYTTPTAWTFALQSESAYDWEREEWSVPVNAAVSKLVRFGKLPVSLQAGLGYWAESPDNGPEDFRARFQIVFLLPR
jgi:hypothetical protein